ncbi:hypothetical protein THRCLA_07916 [Thraustotheca clavata]|uniref:EF-hand domain-containing protein n=1 Tax=Thraustotheca clavata TaxID=74557 RepID=A0A1V9ZBL3_9STRA|nr:hypothetical protein THRCLA_07916 [Thraustotheca clavata]
MSELADTQPLTIQRVLLWTFFVVIFVSLLETGLHKLIHLCKDHRKYNEMLNKVTGELMVVGFIYLIVKLVCYFNVIQYGGVQYYSLDAADMLLFFVVLALVVQSLIVFARLRFSNAKIDDIMISEASALVQMAEAENEKIKNYSWFTRMRSNYYMHNLLEHKLLELYFRDARGLPTMFTFAKYIREIQDCQIVDLIEIDILGYSLLLLLLAAFFACTGELQAHSLYRSSYDITSSLYQISSQMDDKRKWVFKFFAWSLTGAMVLMAIYLKVLIYAVINQAKNHFLIENGEFESKYEELVEALKRAGAKEEIEGKISTEEALKIMNDVSEEIRGSIKKRKGYFKHNLVVQMLQSIYRKLTQKNKSPLNSPLNNLNPSIKIPFSRKFVEFCVRTFLIVNGLYYSMLIACIVPTLSNHELQFLTLLLIPLLLNTFWLAPLLVHKFSLLNGTLKVDPTRLCAVIDHIREVEELNVKMVKQVCKHLQETGKSLNDMRDEMTKDATDGYIDSEALRLILNRFGFKLSRHKFHTLIYLKYQTRGITVKFDDVLTAFLPHRGTVLASHHSLL